MATRTVQLKVDDLDGKDLPDSTRPWRVTWQGKKYDLYVSPENRQRIESYMDALFKDAKRVPERKPKSGNSRKSDRSIQDLRVIRTWLRENGHDVPAVGQIRKDLIAIYDAAHADQNSDAKA